MKKSTFILSLLLAFLGVTATAQTSYAYKKLASTGIAITSLENLTDGGKYALYNPRYSKYIKMSLADNLLMANDATLSADDETDGLAVFTLHKTAENTFSFETAVSGCYMQAAKNSTQNYAAFTTNPSTFVVSAIEGEAGKFKIKNSGNSNYFDMTDNYFCSWVGAGDGCKYQFIPVTLSEEVVDKYRDVTITLKAGEDVLYTETSVKADGTTISYTTPLSYYYTNLHCSNTDMVVSSTNYEFNYTVDKGTIPVNLSTAESKTWYALQIMNNGTRTVKAYYESDDAAWHVMTIPSAFNATDLGDYDGFNRAIWAFEECGTGVKLYNKGTDKYLKWTRGFATLESAANATTFYLATNSTNTNNGFSLWTGSGNQYLNASETKNSQANARLGVWNDANSKNDAGSCFRFWSVDEANASLVNVGKDCINNITPNEADANYVTAGLAADITAAYTAAASATNIEGLDAVVATLNYPNADIDANAYYRIGNVNLSNEQKKFVSSENIFVGTDGVLATAYNANTGMDRIVRRVPATGNFTSMLWKLEKKADGTYFVRNANTGCNLSEYVGTGIDMPVDVASGGSYTFKAVPTATFSGGNDGKTMLQILVNGHRINAFQGNDNNIISDYNGNNDNDKGNYWQFEKVTSVPVSISSALYASVGFPFAVQVPAGSGVKAYYATAAADGELTLSEIADGIIPANTGAILAATAATNVNLTIVTTDKSLDNKLVAATAKRTGFAADANYMLGVDSDSEVKFLQATINTVPANKAYLPAANVTNSSSALAFNFGGESTGIANTLKDNEEVQYFDLNGRVVLYPSNGVFITNTGKKVFIK